MIHMADMIQVEGLILPIDEADAGTFTNTMRHKKHKQ
jgi:hypothetical protein